MIEEIDSPQFPETYNQYRAQFNRRFTRIGSLLVAILVPAGTTLDLFVQRAHLWEFMSIRIATSFFSLLVFLLTYSRFGQNHPFFIGAAPIWGAAIGMEIMIVKLGAYASSYYAGLNLCIIGLGLAYFWTIKESTIACSLVIAIWNFPIFFSNQPIEFSLYYNNLYFLVLTSILAITFTATRVELLRREYETRKMLHFSSEKLREIDKAKNQFFSNITHELRTPLTMILAPVETLLERKDNLTKYQVQSLNTIQSQALQVLKMINDLLDLAKIEENFLRLRVEDLDIHTLLDEIVTHSKTLAERNKLTIEYTCDTDVHSVYCDPEKMERVFVNLISNAIKFTPEGGRIEVRLSLATAPTERVIIEVIDSGIGIPMDKQDAVFDRFVQADASITRTYGGTGIGLAFSKEVVDLHGGHIRVSSIPNEGSTFRVELMTGEDHFQEEVLDRRKQIEARPQIGRRLDDTEGKADWQKQITRSDAYRFLELSEHNDEIAEDSIRRISQTGEVHTVQTKTVLLVEDTTDIRRFIASTLSEEGYIVITANNGEEGLAQAKQELPDIIVSDYMMPKMDGVSMIAELRQLDGIKDRPIVMLSAKSDIASRVKGREAGADVYLSKPFSARELKATLAGLLKKQDKQLSMIVDVQSRTLESICAGLSHEIKNPLSYIKNAQEVVRMRAKKLAKMALDGTLDETTADKIVNKIDKMVDISGKGIQRIDEMIGILRKYAREGYQKETTSIGMDDAISNITALIAPKDDKIVKIDTDLNAPDFYLPCIPEDIHQAMRNPIQNAVDASPDGKNVTVRSQVLNGVYTLTIDDSGLGVPKALMSRIFSPFFSTKAPGKGMGIGLSITRQIIAQHGGTAKIWNKENNGDIMGATFEISIPMPNQIRQTRTSVPIAPDIRPTSGRNGSS